MRTQRLGRTDLELTVVGLGTWAIGGSWQFGWGPQDDVDSIDTIFRAFELGINWIDTAPIYGCGHSEEIVGKALGRMGKKAIVATKCGLRWNENREKINDLSPAGIERECGESLERLGADVIDLYQLHWPVPDGQIEHAWEAMGRCVDRGWVRYLGACNVSVEQIQRLRKVYPVAAVQPPYSILSRGIEDELLDYCGREGIGVVCYSPMQKGLLTGKFTKEYISTLAEDDHRLRDRDFIGRRFEKNLALVEELKAIAAEYGRTVAQLAIAWTLRRGEITAAIVGARRPGQIEQTAPAGDWEIDADLAEKIEKILLSHNL